MTFATAEDLLTIIEFFEAQRSYDLADEVFVKANTLSAFGRTHHSLEPAVRGRNLASVRLRNAKSKFEEMKFNLVESIKKDAADALRGYTQDLERES